MSQKDNKLQDFADVSPNIRKNPELLSFLASEGESDLAGTKLDKMDYLAIFIALIETVFFPVLLLMLLLIAISLFLTYLPYIANFASNILHTLLANWVVTIFVILLISLVIYIQKTSNSKNN